MNTVNVEAQKLFSKYEDRVRTQGQNRSSDKATQSDALAEIQMLRQFWDHGDWDWETDRSLERRLKCSLYLKMWEQVQNKLAMRTEMVSDVDYWWTPPQHQETVNLLWELTRILRKAASPWWRHLGTVAWHVARELLKLGITVALLLFSRTTFETRVIALLVLIYNAVVLETASSGLVLNSIQVRMGDEVERLARFMKLKAPVPTLKTSEQIDMGTLLTHVSCLSAYLGSLIAVLALVWSLF